MKFLKKEMGFTLIELLVVISIIAVLATIVLSSLGDARSKARDARRLSDMKQIQNALEMYYIDNGNYPQTNGWSVGSGGWTTLSNNLSPYIQIPVDPINISNTHYRYYGNLVTTYECAGRVWQDYGYVIAFRMENPNDNITDSTYSPFTKCVHAPI